jgi:hypothetical protein
VERHLTDRLKSIVVEWELPLMDYRNIRSRLVVRHDLHIFVKGNNPPCNARIRSLWTLSLQENLSILPEPHFQTEGNGYRRQYHQDLPGVLVSDSSTNQEYHPDTLNCDLASTKPMQNTDHPYFVLTGKDCQEEKAA